MRRYLPTALLTLKTLLHLLWTSSFFPLIAASSTCRSTHLEDPDLEDRRLPLLETAGESQSASKSFVLLLRLNIGLTSFLNMNELKVKLLQIINLSPE